VSADPLLERVNRALAHRHAVTRELGAGGMVLPPSTRQYLGARSALADTGFRGARVVAP